MQLRKIVYTVLLLIVWGFLTEYSFMPTLSFTASEGIYFNWLILSVGLFVIWIVPERRKNAQSLPLNPIAIIPAITAIGSLLAIIIGMFATGAMFHADEYQKLIGTVEETPFTSNVQPISSHQMLVVDEGIAKRVGEKELGAVPGLGSRAEVGKFTLQAVNGQLYWIAPLEHSGFFKWNRFKNEGTPGYIKVSATNPEDYKLVQSVGEKDVSIKYQNGSYFGQDLERHIYTSGYRSVLFGEFLFEVDDNWNPYWTVTLYDTKVVFGGRDAIGVLTVNPETGEIKQYGIDDAPKWIDRIQPSSFVYDQVDDWGEYVHGWWNWSGSDIVRVASESSIVLGSDGHAYFYYGITSDGNDNSTVGFMMVDTRTKKAHWFKQAGATEDAARHSAEGKVQEKGYSGSDGVTYNIDGYPTYEFLLKDKAGLMKQIALVNVHDHNIVGTGEDRQEALQDYRAQMNTRGNTVSINTSVMEDFSISSKVARFGSEINKGNTYYYFVLADKQRVQFSASSSISTELSLTQVGDVVVVHYTALNTDGGVTPITAFDNQSLGITKDSVQLANEARLDSVRQNIRSEKSEAAVDNQIDNLSPEKKKELLKLLQTK